MNRRQRRRQAMADPDPEISSLAAEASDQSFSSVTTISRSTLARIRQGLYPEPQTIQPQVDPTTMADRFPSLEDLNLGNEPTAAASGQGSFLDRERAALGDDAQQFATAQDQVTTAATVQDDDNDLLGEDFGEPQQAATATTQENVDFEKSFPAIDTQNEAVAPGGTITGTTGQAASGYTGYTAPADEEEPEPMRKWREKRDADIARREAISAAKREAKKAQAKLDVDKFYENYNRKTEKQRAETAREAAEFLKNRQDTTAGGTTWERIAKLTDLSGNGQDGGGENSTKKKMREILLNLAKDENAPGAKGA